MKQTQAIDIIFSCEKVGNPEMGRLKIVWLATKNFMLLLIVETQPSSVLYIVKTIDSMRNLFLIASLVGKKLLLPLAGGEKKRNFVLWSVRMPTNRKSKKEEKTIVPC